MKGFKFAPDDTADKEQHQQQAEDDDANNNTIQTVIAAEDVALGTDHGDAPSRSADGLVKHEAVLSIEVEPSHAFLAVQHGVAEGGACSILSFEGLGEDALVE